MRILSSSKPVARRTHRCDICEKYIRPGDTYVKRFCVHSLPGEPKGMQKLCYGCYVKHMEDE